MKKLNKRKINYDKRIRIGIIILFIFAFIILINKQKENNNLADIIDNKFYTRTVLNKQIVVRDLSAIYPKYFVFYFDNTDNTYFVHSFNYYQTDSQYELEFYNHLKNIIDYNYSDYMIRYFYDNGIGNYNSVIDEIGIIINSDNYIIY